MITSFIQKEWSITGSEKTNKEWKTTGCVNQHRARIQQARHQQRKIKR